jgi:hypothetical protein
LALFRGAVSVSRVYQRHPLSDRFSPLRDWSKPFKALRADIKAHGLHEEIVLHQGRILDGWNRYRACLTEGVDPRFRQFGDRPEDGTDPAAFVESMNQHRRHLTAGQCTHLASLEAAGTRGGDRRSSDQNVKRSFDPSPTIAEAAANRGVSASSVDRYRKICEGGVQPEVIQAVAEGRVRTIGHMAKIAKLPADKQAEAVKDWEKIRAEYPDLFEKKLRGKATDAEKILRAFDAAPDAEKLKAHDQILEQGKAHRHEWLKE